MLSALAIVLGQFLAPIPNVELITLVVFAAGYLGGYTGGIVTALTTTICFNFLNPMGAVILPVLAIQGVSWSIVAAGGASFYIVCGEKFEKYYLAIAGALVTLQYQVFLNIAFFLFFTDQRSIKAFTVVIIAALPFSLVHIVWNTAVFYSIGKRVLEIVGKHR